jgi:hypothetical protein
VESVLVSVAVVAGVAIAAGWVGARRPGPWSPEQTEQWNARHRARPAVGHSGHRGVEPAIPPPLPEPPDRTTRERLAVLGRHAGFATALIGPLIVVAVVLLALVHVQIYADAWTARIDRATPEQLLRRGDAVEIERDDDAAARCAEGSIVEKRAWSFDLDCEGGRVHLAHLSVAGMAVFGALALLSLTLLGRAWYVECRKDRAPPGQLP